MLHPDFQEWVSTAKPAKVVLLYHWDCDGLASCALFINFFEEVSPATEIIIEHPTINRYFLVNEEFERIAAYGADAVVMMDFNAPLDTITRLEEGGLLFVFDNHAQTADIDRPGLQDTKYPSASMLINDYLMKPLSLVSVLGAVGDKEEAIRDEAEFWPQVREMMEESGLDWPGIMRLTKLVDTMYMLGDSRGMADTIDILRRDPKLVLTDARFVMNEQKISDELKRVLNQEPKTYIESADLVSFEFISEVSVLSEATRAKAREFADKVVLTWQSKGGLDMVYIRTRTDKIDCRKVTEFARGLGQNSGGKPEVAGIVLLDMTLSDFLPKVEKFLLDQLS